MEHMQWFDGEYGIFFQDFYIFSLVQSTSKNFKKSCITSEINSIFIVKNLEFSVYYIFYGFWTHLGHSY